MSAQPTGPDPRTGSYDVIHLGGRSAVVVPLAEYLRLWALEEAASADALEDAEDMVALQAWQDREATGTTSYVPAQEARQRLGL